MRVPSVSPSRRPALFGIFAVLLSVWILYSASVRRALLGRDLAFIPLGGELLVVTGDIESLWNEIDRHFGEVFLDEESEAGRLTEFFRDARDGLDEEDLRIAGIEDLVGYGVDPARGVTLAVRRFDSDDEPVDFLALMPVSDSADFTRLISEQSDGGADEVVPVLGATGAKILSYDDVLLAYPGAGHALLTNPDYQDHLQRSLLNRNRNLAHAWADDPLYEAVRARLSGGPLGLGPKVFAFWRPIAQPGIEQMTGVMSFLPDALHLEMEMKATVNTLQVLDDFISPRGGSVDWHRYLGSETAAALVVEDEELAGYLRFIMRFATTRSFMDDRYGGVLSALQGIDGLRRAVLAVTGYRDGLPELLLGVWGDPDGLTDLVQDLQLRHREERDRSVLEGALDAYVARAATDPDELQDRGPPSVAALREAGLLTEADEPTFDQYVLRVPARPSGRAAVEALGLADLDDATYMRSYGRDTIRYILPPITDNDILYVPEFADVDADALTGDHYRLATVVLDSILWVATDVRDVEAQIDRAEADTVLPDLSSNTAFRAARDTWSGRERIRGFLDVDRITTLGLLSPESDLEDSAKDLLLDLRNHPTVAFTVRSDEAGARIFLDVFAVLRPGLRDR